MTSGTPGPGEWPPPAAPQGQWAPPQPGYGSPYPGGGAPAVSFTPAHAAKAPNPERFELAGWGRRFAAFLIDGIVVFALAALLTLLLGTLLGADLTDFGTREVPGNSESLFWDGESETAYEPTGEGWLWLGIGYGFWFLLTLLYGPILVTLWKGRTIGKRMLGITIVTDLGWPPTAGTAWLRELVAKQLVIGFFGGMFVLPMAVSYLWPLWDEQSRAGQDFMARTRVVRDRPTALAPGAGLPA